MKKGAWARSGIHLFSFPPPQSEEGPAGELRAASFVTLNVLQPPPVLLSRCLRDLMRERAPGSYRHRVYVYTCVRLRACMCDMALAVALSRNIFQELWEILSSNVP